MVNQLPTASGIYRKLPITCLTHTRRTIPEKFGPIDQQSHCGQLSLSLSISKTHRLARTTFTVPGMRPDGPRPAIVGNDAGPEPPFPLKLDGKVIKGFGRGSKEVSGRLPTPDIKYNMQIDILICI